MKYTWIAGITLSLLGFSACNDETLEIGKTLTTDYDKFNVSTADYQVSTQTILADSVLLRNNASYLGRMKDPETGAYITGEFMTQLHILEGFNIVSQDSVLGRYEGLAAADSCEIRLYMDKPTADIDTLAAMKIRMNELNNPMDESMRYYSNYDPIALGFIRKNGLQKDKIFSYQDLTVNEDARKEPTYYNNIRIMLNGPYTDKQGKTYNNYGTYIMQQYYQHPEYFKSAFDFIQHVCPGFYFSVLDGEESYVSVTDIGMIAHYHFLSSDSVIKGAITLAGTEEVMQTTKISNEKEAFSQLVADNSCTYLKSPAGLFTEVTLPIEEIYRNHSGDSIMTAKISFQRINNQGKGEAFRVPQYVLMVPKDSLYSFFEKRKTPDSKTTFYTNYNANSNQYTFTNISSLITSMNTAMKKGTDENGNWKKLHPNWDKVVLVPLKVTFTSSSSTGSQSATAFDHDASVSSTRLVGGSANTRNPVKINIVYGQFSKQ